MAAPGTFMWSYNKKVVKPKELQLDASVSYVSHYFSKNGHQKPKITVSIYDTDLDQIRNEVHHRFENATLTPILASTYLYLLAEHIKGDLTEDWVSYQVKIGGKNTEMTPLDICDFVPAKKIFPGTTGVNAYTNAADIYLAIGVCEYYRVALSTSTGSYDETIKQKIMTLMKDYGYTGSSLVKKDESFGNQQTFGALIAAYDMFMVRFPDHPYAIVRGGTVTSRNQDNGVLSALQALRHMLNLPISEIVLWIFCPSVARDIEWLTDSPDELDQFYSYTPYLHGFRLAQKSPYSTQNCRNLHQWIHIIGCAMGSTRSKNARYLDDTDLSNVPKNAILVAYAFSRSQDFDRQAHRDQEDYDEYNQDKIMRGGITVQPGVAPPDEQNPILWFYWFKEQKFNYTKSMKSFIDHSKIPMDNSRDGSEGAWYKDHAFY